MQKTGIVISLVAIAAISSSLTYYFAPEKVKIKEVTKVVEVKGETKIVNRDVVKTIVKEKDGTVTTRIIDKSKENTVKEEKTNTDIAKSKEITRKKKNWMVGGGALTPNLSNRTGSFYVQVKRRIIGEIYIGGIVTSDGQIGGGLHFRF